MVCVCARANLANVCSVKYVSVRNTVIGHCGFFFFSCLNGLSDVYISKEPGWVFLFSFIDLWRLSSAARNNINVHDNMGGQLLRIVISYRVKL